MRFPKIWLILFTFWFLEVHSQDVDNQLWINYAPTVQLTQNLSYGGDIGARGLVSNEDWNQILIRPNVSYRFNQIFSVQAATAWFGTFNQDEDNVNEYRLHQDFNLSWPDLSIVSFFYRLRLEQRWFFYINEPDDFNWRTRFLVGAESQDFLGDKTIFGGRRPIYLQALFEIFNTKKDKQANEFFVNNSRAHFAIGQRFSNNFRYEFHFIRQRSRFQTAEGLRTSQNIFRVRFFQRINKIKQQTIPSGQ